MTIDEIKAQNKAAGNHFFDADTLRFFGSRISETVYEGDGGVFFITSEQPPHGKRAYTVRKFNTETALIERVGEFCVLSRTAAHNKAKKCAANPQLLPATQE